MTHAPTVEVGQVFVVRETKLALLCRIGVRSHWLAHSRLQPGSTVQHPGDLGVLVLTWDFAVERGLVFLRRAPPLSDKRRRPLCDGLRGDGLPCRGTRRPDSHFCFAHDPTTAREREVGQARALANARDALARRREKPAH